MVDRTNRLNVEPFQRRGQALTKDPAIRPLGLRSHSAEEGKLFPLHFHIARWVVGRRDCCVDILHKQLVGIPSKAEQRLARAIAKETAKLPWRNAAGDGVFA